MRNWFILPVLALFARTPAVGGAQPDALAPEKLRQIEQIVAAEAAKRQIPGLAIALAHRDRIVWEKALGLADLENNLPLKENARFRIASLAKPMTAVAVMQQFERGKINLDADVREYVEAFPAKPWPITIRQLLGHLGGIRHYDTAKGEHVSTAHYANLADALEMFAQDPLLHKPGTKYQYTTYGYNLVGLAVQEAAGVPYAELLKTSVLQPARMTSTVPDDVYAIIPHRVRGYLRTSDNRVVNCQLADTSNKLPGGGWLSTASDMARFAIAFRQCRLTKCASVDAMIRPMRTADNRGTGYGMGWQTWGQRTKDGDNRIVGHTGSQPGANSFLGMTQDGVWIVAILTNLEGATPKTIADQIFDVLRVS
jgi:CubicO group peptidase (beta-lactamase class C family)